VTGLELCKKKIHGKRKYKITIGIRENAKLCVKCEVVWLTYRYTYAAG